MHERVLFLEDMHQRLYEFEDTIQDLSSSLKKAEDNMAAEQQEDHVEAHEGQRLNQIKVIIACVLCAIKWQRGKSSKFTY